MRFIEHNEIWEWCADHGVALEDHRPATDGYQPVIRLLFGENDSERELRAVSEEVLTHLGAWDDCLLWVTDWGIWSSTEDWPTYYAARGALGERRDLATAPGLLLTTTDQSALLQFLEFAMQNGWDAHLLPVRGTTGSSTRAFSSHDAWIEVRARSA